LTRLCLSANDAAHCNARGGCVGYRVRAEWVAEQIFEANGMDGVHLRMKCFFLENLLLVDAPGSRLFNRISNAWDNTSLSWLPFPYLESGRDGNARAGVDGLGALAGKELHDASRGR
jgi:hypothetical protein